VPQGRQKKEEPSGLGGKATQEDEIDKIEEGTGGKYGGGLLLKEATRRGSSFGRTFRWPIEWGCWNLVMAGRDRDRKLQPSETKKKKKKTGSIKTLRGRLRERKRGIEVRFMCGYI